MTKAEYRILLRHPKWKEKRLIILNRDKFLCQRCGRRKARDVHHRYYQGNKDPWDYPNNVLVSLCGNCHQIEHEYKSLAQFINPENPNHNTNRPRNLKKQRDRIRNSKEFKDKKKDDRFLRKLIEKTTEDILLKDNNYIKVDKVLTEKEVKVAGALLNRDEVFYINYNHPELVNPETKWRTFVNFYLPLKKKVIFLNEPDPYKVLWCRLKRINFITIRGKDLAYLDELLNFLLYDNAVDDSLWSQLTTYQASLKWMHYKKLFTPMTGPQYANLLDSLFDLPRNEVAKDKVLTDDDYIELLYKR